MVACDPAASSPPAYPMNLKTVFVFFLMVVVALFSVQNAGPITVRFLHWQFAMSQALVIMLSAFAGAMVGLAIGTLSGLARSARTEKPAPPAPPPTT